MTDRRAARRSWNAATELLQLPDFRHLIAKVDV